VICIDFSKNEDIREKTLGYGREEASPFDRIWGIGMSEKNAITKRGKKWGLNLLGKESPGKSSRTFVISWYVREYLRPIFDLMEE